MRVMGEESVGECMCEREVVWCVHPSWYQGDHRSSKKEAGFWVPQTPGSVITQGKRCVRSNASMVDIPHSEIEAFQEDTSPPCQGVLFGERETAKSEHHVHGTNSTRTS